MVQVTKHNVKLMKQLVVNGPDKHPGANFITQKGQNKRYMYICTHSYVHNVHIHVLVDRQVYVIHVIVDRQMYVYAYMYIYM